MNEYAPVLFEIENIKKQANKELEDASTILAQ